MKTTGKYRNAKHGWYRIVNLAKYRRPLDETMDSTRAGFVEYKSSLELRAFQYADANPAVKWWALEPFAIMYIKPTDGKVHRYFPDILLYQNDHLILVEIKSYNETIPPPKPKTQTSSSVQDYQEKLKTFYINQAKWHAAKEFCIKRNMHFCILTERDLK